MSLHKKILLLAPLLCLQPAFATAPLKCTGLDSSSGLTVHVDVDSDAHKLLVDGNELEILANTDANGSTTITTENDVMEPSVRNVLIITGDKGVLNKVSIGTNNVSSSLSLKCARDVSDAVKVADAGTYLVTYVAEISHDDRYADNGTRLTTVRDILKRDRFRFRNHLSHDAYDSDDTSDDNNVVSSAVNDLFDTDKINIDPALEKKILGDSDVVLKVYVSSSNEMTVVEYVNPQKSLPSPPAP